MRLGASACFLPDRLADNLRGVLVSHGARFNPARLRPFDLRQVILWSKLGYTLPRQRADRVGDRNRRLIGTTTPPRNIASVDDGTPLARRRNRGTPHHRAVGQATSHNEMAMSWGYGCPHDLCGFRHDFNAKLF